MLMNQNKELFETIPVPKALATLAVPTIISQLITLIYNLADTFFIGKTNDPYKVAAVSVVFVLYFIMGSLSNLFGIGGSSLISRLLGKQQPEEAKKVCALSFFGTITIGLIYSLCSFIFMRPLLYLMGASENTYDYAVSYTFWVVVIGGIPSALSTTMAHLLRSEGHAKKASFGLGMGGILNIILDPLFMFVILKPGNEVTGAAVATMLSNVFSMLYFIGIFIRLRGSTALNFSPRLLPAGLRYMGQVCAVGLPSTLSSMLACASNLTSNNLASGHGDIALAAMGIVKKIDMLPLNVAMGLCQGMMPLVAYNYAAQNYKRMKMVTNCARLSGIAVAAVCIVCFELFAGRIVNMFIDETKTLALGTDFLRIGCLATPIMICNFQMIYCFQAMGMGSQSLLLSACRQGIFNIPMLIIMNAVIGLYGIVWAQLIADCLTVIISFTLYNKTYKKLTLVN